MTEPTVEQPPKKLALLWKCFAQGLFWTPLCVFAPAGVLQLLGFRPTESTIFLVAVVVFPLAMTAVLYAQTLSGERSVEQIVDQMAESIGNGLANMGRSIGGCALGLVGFVALLFVVLGIIGLLVFGIRQIL